VGPIRRDDSLDLGPAPPPPPRVIWVIHGDFEGGIAPAIHLELRVDHQRVVHRLPVVHRFNCERDTSLSSFSTARMRMSEVRQRGAELGKGSFGVVSATELRDSKIDMSTVARLVGEGSWTWLWRGMYLCEAHPVSPLVRAHAATKHARQRLPMARTQPPAVISGLAGAQALGLRWLPRACLVSHDSQSTIDASTTPPR